MDEQTEQTDQSDQPQPHPPQTAEMPPNNLYQYSILSALMHGICHRGPSVTQVLTHSDHGLGTVCGLNGEITILNGKAYHFAPDTPEPQQLDSQTPLPFIMTTRFAPTFTNHVKTLQMSSLTDALYPLLPSQQNRFLSLRLRAKFPRISFRIIPAQSRPQESLSELAKRQSIREERCVCGELFGFWSPAFTNGFSVAGFHLHFVSDDRAAGGHVMDFEAEEVTVEAAAIDEYRVELPDDGEFNETAIGEIGEGELHAAEGGH